jgi:hypothetical protein
VIDRHSLNIERRPEAAHRQRTGALPLDQRHRPVEDQIPV